MFLLYTFFPSPFTALSFHYFFFFLRSTTLPKYQLHTSLEWRISVMVTIRTVAKQKKKKWFYEHIANGCITNVNCWLSQQQEKGLRVFVGSENGRRSSCKTGYFKWCRVVKKTFPRSLSCKMTTYYTDCCLTHCFFFHQLIDVSVIHLKYKLFLMFYHPPLHSNVVRKRKKKCTCNMQLTVLVSIVHPFDQSFIHSFRFLD